MANSQSQLAFKEATDTFPGGVNSPSRSFRSVGGTPLFFHRAKGALITDDDGKQYVDFVQGWGTHVLGHSPPAVLSALRSQAGKLLAPGAPTTLETEFALELRKAFPSLEKLRFVNSGTEAVMSALRVARAATARPLVVKFDGCYHGHSDGLLVQPGSGLSSVGLPSSSGVDPRQASGTISIPFNDLNAVLAAFEAKPDKIAAVLVEPVATTMGLVLPKSGFLVGLKRLCQRHGALLIFDEGATAFRLCYGGAQTLFDVVPDLTTLGKTLAGGIPVGAYGGRKEFMELVAPQGPVYQAGTLSGNPLAMASGLAVLRELKKPRFYERLDDLTGAWSQGLHQLAAPGRATVNTLGGMFTLFFHKSVVTDFTSANAADQDTYGRFFHRLLGRGVYFPPSAFEAGFVGAGHSRKQLKTALKAVEEALTDLHS